MRRSASEAFTLVELLIVISIIGILVALLMPAVNSARESARRAHCCNNLHQMALACTAVESKFGFLPGGGWGWQWAGEPDRGFGARQPGGWHYSILPFIDQADLHDMGKGLAQPGDTPGGNAARRNAGKSIAQVPVTIFFCPTRNRIRVLPYTHSASYVNIPDPYPVISRSDYAANSGSNVIANSGDVQPGNANSGDTIDGVSYPPYALNYPWYKLHGSVTAAPPYTASVTINGSNYGVPNPSTGVIYRASECTSAMIKDGESYTYLIGERYLCIDCYNGGSCCDNDQGWDEGYDWDSNKWTAVGHFLPGDESQATPIPPMRDRSGYATNGGCSWNFGGPHPAGFNMAFCDGSIARMNWDVDLTIHMQLGHRSDGQPTQLQNISTNR